MSRIRILSDHLANQIAAGEVVERPASVVKELVENSLDAGATRIDVHVEGNGTRLLRIADNGSGMDQDDVLLCIERHATSKLHEESQLGAIATLGFRGEAIPSIGSVARMTILSRAQEQGTGTRAEVRYGTLHAVHEEGCAKGTVIEVRNLFGNMPARKKFLKSKRTETYHIEEVIKNQALAHPATGFTLQVDSRLTLDYPVDSDLEQRIRDVFRYQGRLLPLEGVGFAKIEDLSVGGYLLLPDSTPARTARLRILVNHRPVQDKTIRHGVSEGMQGFLMKGYQPAGALLISLSPDLVDVNVHPSKREIRFRDGQQVHQAVVDTVARSIRSYQEQVRGELFTSRQRPPSSEPWETTTAEPAPVTVLQPQPLPTRSHSPSPPVSTDIGSTGREVIEPAPAVSPPTVSAGELRQDLPDEDLRNLVLIGQLFSLYLLCEKEDRFIVIDQHAAHERILYGRFRQEYTQQRVPRQSLMFPKSVELGPDHIETLESRRDDVAGLGLDVEHFGDTTWIIKAVPAIMQRVDPVEILHEVLDRLHGVRISASEVVPAAIDDLLATLACKAAVKAGNRLQPEEMLELLHQMEESALFSHCPHGRPVIKTFDSQDVEKWFHRHGG